MARVKAKAKARPKTKVAAKPRSKPNNTMRVPRPPKPAAMPARTTAEERAFAETAIGKVAGPHTKAAIAQLRASILIYTKRTEGLPVGASKYGGIPDLPPGTRWPMYDKNTTPMQFIAQFALPELADFDVDNRLPRTGLLSFFFGFREVAVLHSTGEVRPATLPKEFGKHPPIEASLRFRTRFELPTRYDGVVPMADCYCLERTPIDRNSGQLLGYDDHHGYDPPLASGTSLLFRCASDEQADFEFGDVQDIAFRIRDHDLARGNFETVMMWFQAG